MTPTEQDNELRENVVDNTIEIQIDNFLKDEVGAPLHIFQRNLHNFINELIRSVCNECIGVDEKNLYISEKSSGNERIEQAKIVVRNKLRTKQRDILKGKLQPTPKQEEKE